MLVRAAVLVYPAVWLLSATSALGSNLMGNGCLLVKVVKRSAVSFADTPLLAGPVGAGDHPGDKAAGHSQAKPYVFHKDSSAIEDPCHEFEGPAVC